MSSQVVEQTNIATAHITSTDVHVPVRLPDLLRAASDLTAVEHFSAYHDDPSRQLPNTRYHDLIPLSTPKVGEQYAFEVDLDCCTGCKACVSACHHLNGLSEGETWRQVGVLVGERDGLSILQHVTTACHHCETPSCLSGCPTNAYVKDAATGIVRHLDDQCFGCQYCTMACPYEVPQFNRDLGIVRKCDMCHARLSGGEAPACVQACPSQAIRIVVLQTDPSRTYEAGERLLPTAPRSSISRPTTRFRSVRPLPDTLRPGNAGRVSPQPTHLPLVLMLVLTQMSVGTASVATWTARTMLIPTAFTNWMFAIALVCGVVGVMAATLHLGRPHLAFRGLLGWRHSWLSREAIAFGLYVALLPVVMLSDYGIVPLARSVTFAMALLATIFGWCGIYSSIRIYQFTHRIFWVGYRTSAKFIGTSLITSVSAMIVVTLICDPTSTSVPHLIATVAGLVIVKLAVEALAFNTTNDAERPYLSESSQTARVALANITAWRRACAIGVTGCALLVALLNTYGIGGESTTIAALCLLFLAGAGECLERAIYFRAVVPLRMPGGFLS